MSYSQYLSDRPLEIGYNGFLLVRKKYKQQAMTIDNKVKKTQRLKLLKLIKSYGGGRNLRLSRSHNMFAEPQTEKLALLNYIGKKSLKYASKKLIV